MNRSAGQKSLLKRLALIAAEVLLVLLTLAMIGAVLLPVIKGASPDARNRDMFGMPGRRH